MLQKLPKQLILFFLAVILNTATSTFWYPETLLGSSGLSTFNQNTIVVDPSGRIHIVRTINGITYKRWNPGSGWTVDTIIVPNQFGGSVYQPSNPSIACDSSGVIHIVWQAYYAPPPRFPRYIFHKSCVPTGNGNGGWQIGFDTIARAPDRWFKDYPVIAAGPDNRLHVVWTEMETTAMDTIHRLRYAERIGSVWQTPVTIESTNRYHPYYFRYPPNIAVGRDNRVHVAWHGSLIPYGPDQVFYRCRTNTVWGAIENVSQGVSYHYDPSIAVNPTTDQPHIVWGGFQDDPVNMRIIHKFRTNMGWTLADTISEFPFPHNQGCPKMTFTSGKGHVVWIGWTTSNIYPQVRYRERDRQGNWGTIVNLTDSTLDGQRRYLSIANGGNSSLPNDVHLIWADERGFAGWWLYYRHGRPDQPDLLVSRILPPFETVIDYGTIVTPQAIIRNCGSDKSSPFWVKFEIGGVYTDSQIVSGLAYNDSTIVSFTPWTATTKGLLFAKCSTMVADDNPNNNRAISWVFVQLEDVQPTKILAPKGLIDSGAIVIPRVRVRNNGTESESFGVRLQISSSYDNQVSVILVPDRETTLTFPSWQASASGKFTVRCSTKLTDDMIPANDLLVDSGEVMKFNRDVGIIEILDPTSLVWLNTTVNPKVRVKNYNSEATLTSLRFIIIAFGEDEVPPLYDRTDSLVLNPGQESLHVFSQSWLASPAGIYTASAYSITPADSNPQNDTAGKNFLVEANQLGGWQERASILAEVKDGGWLTNVGSKIYAMTGNKNRVIYSYDPTTNAWQALALMPLGVENKAPKKGSVGVSDNERFIYVTKGNNTLEFYRYDVNGDSWTVLPEVPVGASGKKVKGGDLVYVEVDDTGYVYLLKGYKTDFARYNTLSGNWENLPEAPRGKRPKWDRGSWLVSDGQFIFAHKAKYHEFWRFNLTTSTWDTTLLPGMPFYNSLTHRSKKSKDGGCATTFDGRIYALKGGNTTDFYAFDILTATWLEQETIPSCGLSGKKKKVKTGGDIVSFGDGSFYALKGNKTSEFWRFSLSGLLFSVPSVPTMEEQVSISPEIPKPMPTILTLATVRNILKSSRQQIEIYDITGRKSNHQLRSGVYIFKIKEDGDKRSKKLVIIK